MIHTLIQLVQIASWVFSLLIIVRVIMSWVSPDAHNQIVVVVHRITEPVLAPVRNLLPAMGGIDFSPLLVLIAVQLVEWVLIRVLIGIA